MVFKLLKSVREYKPQSILSPIIVAFEVLLECFMPFVMSKLITYIYNMDLTNIIIYGIILISMAVFSLTCGTLAGWFCSIASTGFAKNLRHDLYKKINSFSFYNIDKFSRSSLVTRITTDVSNVQQSYMIIIRMAVRSPFMLIFSFIMAAIINVKMAIIFVVVVPLLGLALFSIIRRAMPIFTRIFKKYDALNESVQENVKGMRVVKTYVRESFEKDKFNKASGEICTEFTKAEKIVALNSPIMNSSIYIVMLSLISIGSFVIVKTFRGFDGDTYLWGELSTGDLSSLMTYSVQMLISMLFLSMIFVMLTLSIESAKRIVEVLNETPDIKNPTNPIKEVNDGSVIFENVSFKYSKTAMLDALSNINLTINSGETIGILGETGSSKTTLVNLICRLYDVTEGEVIVSGHNVKEYDIETLRNAVAVVLQKNVLFSGTIVENLRWGKSDATLDEIKEACKLACCDEFIETFNDKYDTYIEQGGQNVSGGQKQRLCIARALLKKPKILILDDSTSAVDTKTDAIIQKAMKEYIPTTTKIVIAQRIQSVRDADKIIIMKNGQIDAIGNHESLLKTNAIYQEIYQSQNKVGDENA